MILDYLWRYPAYVNLLNIVDLVSVSYPRCLLLLSTYAILSVLCVEVGVVGNGQIKAAIHYAAPKGVVPPRLAHNIFTGISLTTFPCSIASWAFAFSNHVTIRYP